MEKKNVIWTIAIAIISLMIFAGTVNAACSATSCPSGQSCVNNECVGSDPQSNTNTTANVANSFLSGNGNLLGSVFGTGAGILNKIVGLNPIVHGLIGAALSGFSTYNQLDSVIDFKLVKDQVNISDSLDDYSDSNDTMDQYELYGDELYTNRIKACDYSSGIKCTNMILTDQNILDIEFIKTKSLNDPQFMNDNLKKNPRFRLAEDTEVLDLTTLDGNSVTGQKRGVLFEDPDKTIINSYEFRYLVARYNKATYKDDITIELKTSDLLGNGMIWTYLLMPFSSGKSFFTLDKVLANKAAKEDINKARTTDTITQPFHLQFNSWTTDSNKSLDLTQPDCVNEDGTIIGTTGTEILPKVTFDWVLNSHQSTAINGIILDNSEWCDTNANGKEKSGIYCDATQFTIELMHKLNSIDTYVKAHSNEFICPTPGISQKLITDINNFGVTKLDSSYDGVKNIIVNYEVDGNYNPSPNVSPLYEVEFKIFKLINGNRVLLDTQTIPITLAGKQTGSITSNVGLFQTVTDFIVEATLINFNAAIIDYTVLDDSLVNQFTTNSVECSLEKNSTNIKDFAMNVTPRFEDTKLVDFRSFLMMDGYSNDFKIDFDDYFRKTLMQSPNFYNDPNTGFYKYLIDNEKFIFKTSFESEPGKLVLPGPGRYEITYNVTFDDQWRLFDNNGNMVGSIVVKLNKEVGPEYDAPIYYMPYNGLVGISTPNARQGYGVDYVGDVITFDKDISMKSEPFVSSNTVSTVTVKEIGAKPGDIATLNNGETRGMLFSITSDSTHTNPELRYSPSRATPVVMKISNTQNDAYAFYKLGVGKPIKDGGEAAHPGMSLTKWTGVGECESFTGVSIQEEFLNRDDMLATESEFAPYTPSDTVAYGVEWGDSEIIRRGNVFLRTVLYTPSNFTTGTGMSELVMDSSNDDALFYTIKDTKGSKNVSLGGAYTDIKSLKEIYALVASKDACMAYNPTSMKVYYNPQKIAEKFFGGKLDNVTQNAYVAKNGGCIAVNQ